jgi:hypothetical protein
MPDHLQQIAATSAEAEQMTTKGSRCKICCTCKVNDGKALRISVRPVAGRKLDFDRTLCWPMLAQVLEAQSPRSPWSAQSQFGVLQRPFCRLDDRRYLRSNDRETTYRRAVAVPAGSPERF